MYDDFVNECFAYTKFPEHRTQRVKNSIRPQLLAFQMLNLTRAKSKLHTTENEISRYEPLKRFGIGGNIRI